MGMMLNVECGISCDGNVSQGVLTDSFSKWDFIFPGTIVWSDNCTTAIRPPAKNALSGIRLSLADFGAVWTKCPQIPTYFVFHCKIKMFFHTSSSPYAKLIIISERQAYSTLSHGIIS